MFRGGTAVILLLLVAAIPAIRNDEEQMSDMDVESDVIESDESGNSEGEAREHQNLTGYSEKCIEAVPRAMLRKSHLVRWDYCKCPKDSHIQDCSFYGRYFNPDDPLIAGKGCRCKKLDYIPVGQMIPDLKCPFETSLTEIHPELPDVVKTAHSWCNAEFVPSDKRLPPQLQGFFWMKDAPFTWGDVGFCTSLAEWNSQTRTATFATWTHFVWRKLPNETHPVHMPSLMSSPLAKGGVPTYTLVFEPDLASARIYTNMKLVNLIIKFPMATIPQTDDGMIVHEKPGDLFERPSYFGLGPDFLKFEATSLKYYAVKMVEANGTILKDRYQKMLAVEKTQPPNTYMRYAAKC